MKLAERKETQPETSYLETPHQFNVRKICNLSARLPANEMINFTPREMRLVIYQLHSAVENTSRC